jgi:iron complex outermembrane receptor protein
LLYTGAQRNFTHTRISPSFLTNATLSARPLHSGWDVTLSCYNLFDRHWATPTGPEVDVPGTVQNGRTVRLRISYRWKADSKWGSK